MKNCVIKLQITNYDTDKGELISSFVPIGNIAENQHITVTDLAERIAKLDKKTRSALAAHFRAAKVQPITKKTLSEKPKEVTSRSLVSNVTLSDLLTKYPNLNKYDIPLDLQYKMTLIKCSKAVSNGVIYKGRTIDSEGNEIFIINDFWDADKLFKYLSVKLTLGKHISGNDILTEDLKEYEEDLLLIAKHYKKTIQQLLDDYLVDKNAYNSFVQGKRLYSPKIIIDKVLHTILKENYKIQDKSELQLELEAIKTSGSTSNVWKMEKRRLYNVLTTFSEAFRESYTYDRFNELSAEEVNAVLYEIFKHDVNLLKAKVQSVTRGNQSVKESDEMKSVTIKVDALKEIYETRIKPYLEEKYTQYFENGKIPKTYKDAAEKLGIGLINIIKVLNDQSAFTFVDETGTSHPLTFNLHDKRGLVASYEVKVAPKVKEGASYVVLNMNNFTAFDEIFDVGYSEAQCWFELIKQYKGFYIYKYYKDGVSHYAISRSVIHPKAYVKRFSSEKFAEEAIDNNDDTIRSCGLWSIKQHRGTPRTSSIEMKNLRVGQIITTLDLKLPYLDMNKLSAFANKLLNSTVNNFQNELSFIENRETLDTPEKAAAFIIKTHHLLKKGDNYLTWLQDPKNQEQISKIISEINEATPINYLVEKEGYSDFKKHIKTYYVKLLPTNDEIFDFTKNRPDLVAQDYIVANLASAIDYFNDTFGLDIQCLSIDELAEFSRKNNLGIENKLDTVKAFVYNGQIIINKSIANASDLYHELTHVMLGAIRAQDPETYLNIVAQFSSTNKFKSLYKKNTKTYQHYAERDILEETMADYIADEMFKHRELGSSELTGTAIVDIFEEIFKKSQRFTETLSDNKLGFSKYLVGLVSDTANTADKNRRVTNLIQQYIRDKKINEICL